MNDDQLFGGFTPSPPPAPAPGGRAGEKKTRKKRGPRRQAAPTATTETLPAAETRPKRARKPRQPRAARYTLAEALEITAGLTPDDMALVNQIASALGAQSKAARARIVAAIGRMFA